jgi:hypothetical protein
MLDHIKTDDAVEPVEPPKPPAPVYEQIDRIPGDNASYLGFQCGSSQAKPIIILNHWYMFATHLASPQVISRLGVSADIDLDFHGTTLEVAIYTPQGTQLFRREMHNSNERFDAVKLPASDLLIAYRSQSGCNATGQYDNFEHYCTLAELPAVPLLDELILSPKSDGPKRFPGQCAIPTFKFSSR